MCYTQLPIAILFVDVHRHAYRDTRILHHYPVTRSPRLLRMIPDKVASLHGGGDLCVYVRWLLASWQPFVAVTADN